MSVERHYFPGNNTPQGFFSYYGNILGQREARRIYCIKGGPGTGKSTLIHRIGETFAAMGEDVDYLHCSADENSLDGIVLHGKKVAVIDGTSPHITDPHSPGAVDKIINLGQFWNEEGIAANKAEILDYNEETSKWYRICYNYLNAARSVCRSLEEVYNDAAENSEIYRFIADIVENEYHDYNITLRPGRRKKYFASAVTASGVVHYLDSLLSGVPGNQEPALKRIYLISVPTGYSNRSFMDILAEGAMYRGLDTESYYCAMFPDEKIEHLIIPATGTAFMTLNEYHDIEPWELMQENGPEIILVDVSDYMNSRKLEENHALLTSLRIEYDILINHAVKCLEKARDIHMCVENLYIPNMNFSEIGDLGDRLIEELKVL